jgi:hypothetical protein
MRPSKKDRKDWSRHSEPPSLPTMPPPVDPLVLQAYCERRHPGPTKDYMPFSWTSPLHHPWNKRVIQLLGKEFMKNVEACRYQVMTSLPECEVSGDEFVTKAIGSKLRCRQSLLRNCVRKMTEDSHLSPGEITERIAKQNREASARSRRHERRRNVSCPTSSIGLCPSFCSSTSGDTKSSRRH